MASTWFHHLQRKLERQFGPYFTALFLTLRPYKSLSFYRQYFQVVTGLSDGTNTQAKTRLCLLFLALLYFLLLNGVLCLVPPLSPQLSVTFFDTARFLLADSSSLSLRLFYLIQSLLTLYYYHLMYTVDHGAIHRLVRRLTTRQPKTPARWRQSGGQTIESSMPRIALLSMNALQPFILFIDVYFPLVCLQSEVNLFRHYSDYFFDGSLFGLVSYLSHLAHCFLTGLFWYAYGHILILAAAYRFTLLVYLLLRLAKCTANCRASTLSHFLSETVAIYRIMFAGDRLVGALFLAFITANLPFTAFLCMQLLIGKVSPQARTLLMALVGQSLVAIGFLHLTIAQFSKRIQRAGKMLLTLAGYFPRMAPSGGGSGRVYHAKLSLSLHIARLYPRRPYGLTYGGLAVVSFATFTKCFMLYGKFLMFSYKILKRV